MTSRSWPARVAGVALGGPHHGAGPHRAPGGGDHPGGDGGAPRSARGSVTPRRSTTSARPRTRRAGSTAAQCGVKVPPSTSVAPTRAAPRPGEEARGRPRRCRGPGLGHLVRGSRASWAGVRASTTVPPWWNPHSMPSAATTRPDLADGLLHGQALGRARARDRTGASRVASETLNSAEHQPPLRPDAPNPTTSRSRTAMRRPGSARPGSRPSTARSGRRRRWPRPPRVAGERRPDPQIGPGARPTTGRGAGSARPTAGSDLLPRLGQDGAQAGR